MDGTTTTCWICDALKKHGGGKKGESAAFGKSGVEEFWVALIWL